MVGRIVLGECEVCDEARTAPSRRHLVLVCDSGRNPELLSYLVRAEAQLLLSLMRFDTDSQLGFGVYSNDGHGMLMRRVPWQPATPEGITNILKEERVPVEPVALPFGTTILDAALRSAVEFFRADRNTRVYLITDCVPQVDGTNGLSDESHLNRLREHCASIEVIGYAPDRIVSDMQEGFIADDALRHRNFVDLSPVKSERQRAVIAELSVGFLIARGLGQESVEQYLKLTYDELCEKELFCNGSDLDAREAVRRFVRYLDLDDGGQAQLFEHIFRA